MHRISNAKLYDMEEGAEWWLYESCDGPTCGPNRSGVEIDQWFDHQLSTTPATTSMMTHHWDDPYRLSYDPWNDYAYPWHYYYYLDAADDHWDDPYRLSYDPLNDYAYPWHYDYQHLDAADDHWDDSVHHWETISNNYQHWDDNDHYWNMNQNPPAGADLGCKPSKNLRFRKMQRFLLMIL